MQKIMIQYAECNDIEPSVYFRLNGFIFKELKIILEYFFYKLKTHVKIFGLLPLSEINKLIVLDKAANLGLKIPYTSIISSRSDIPNENRNITKVLSSGISVEEKNKIYKTYTSEVNNAKIPDHFLPSMVQHKIEKAFEIRSFLLEDKIYSMAIFSQENEQTKTDFRKYDYKNPNRTVPFSLPDRVENKLLLLADYFNLKTGSFDLIYSTKGEYVFLEVNPGGQFGMVSVPCNYYLEKKFAESLINQIV
jgi:ATP-GRASP peptide maturase of grasp-with-spasm system